MNPIAEEMMAIYNGESLEHYGTPRHSGRYPWGSGEDPYQHGRDFLSRVEELKKQGWKETAENIQKEFGLNTKDYRNEKTWANYERRLDEVARAKSLKADGLSTTEIGRRMGKNESSIRSLLNADSEARMNEVKETTDFLKKQCDEKGMIDVGKGVEIDLNISKERLDTALYGLKRQGYEVYTGGIKQVTNPGQQTIQRVLCPPGTEHKEIYNFENIHTIKDYISRDGGKTYEKKFTYPTSLDSKRLKIRYNEEGGIEKDGVIELRRGVQDLSLGESRYAQVRIMVDGTHYLKGMAVYSDDMPDGVDVIFNTNKSKGKKKKKVLKPIKDDKDNPFGSLIKDADQGGQYWYTDKKTGEKKLGLINKRADEGDWSEWSNALPSQFLAKQNLTLAKKQLNLAKADKKAEFDDIMSLTNPTIKRHFLKKFAESCDSAAVHLKAAALPGQKYHVIMPFPTMKDTEIYAPNYENGTKLALIRYPHGGTFEIPIVTVNNKLPLPRKLLGTNAGDVVGINSKVAERLSGADFDGDTVMCIPTHDPKGKIKITSTPALKELEGFDPKLEYPARPGMKYMKYKKPDGSIVDNTQKQMGMISNLITDMTLGGAKPEELARAVRHSMVVIDAAKHELDYKKSEKDNNIAALKKAYQSKYDEDGNYIRSGGAATILSRAKGEQTVLKRRGTPKTNIKGTPGYDPNRPEGALIYNTAHDLNYEKRKVNKRTGEVTIVTKQRTQKSTQMAETDDAMTLVSKARHPMELLYADYANSMKALANQARIEEYHTGKLKYDKNAKAIYQNEYNSLMTKLNEAKLNAIRERAALRKANIDVNNKIAENPGISKSDIKKASQQAITRNREEVGGVSRRERSIKITDKEWEAIQAGAISDSKLKEILDNADADKLRERAMPKATTTLSAAKVNRIKALSASNHTLDEIAKKLGVSPTTVSKYLKGVK